MPRHTRRTAQQGQSTHPAQSRTCLLPSQPGTGLPRQQIGPRSQRGLFWYGRRVACLGFHNLRRSGASKQPQLFYYYLGPPCFRSLCRLPVFSPATPATCLPNYTMLAYQAIVSMRTWRQVQECGWARYKMLIGVIAEPPPVRLQHQLP